MSFLEECFFSFKFASLADLESCNQGNEGQDIRCQGGFAGVPGWLDSKLVGDDGAFQAIQSAGAHLEGIFSWWEIIDTSLGEGVPFGPFCFQAEDSGAVL